MTFHISVNGKESVNSFTGMRFKFIYSVPTYNTQGIRLLGRQFKIYIIVWKSGEGVGCVYVCWGGGGLNIPSGFK